MRAVTIRDKQVSVEQHPDPTPGANQVLVRVKAAGVNGADIHQVRGMYPAPPGDPQDIPGLELAGEVLRNGPGASRFAEGDRVMSIAGGGGQAELAVVHERVLMPVPDDLTWAQAGGVGTAAIQLGRSAGARVTATVRNPELRDAVQELGAHVIDPGELGEHGPFDVILELVGAPNLPANLLALETGGRIAVIGIGAGAKAELNLGLLMMKRGRIHASTLRPRLLEEKAMTARAMERSVLPLLASGAVTVPVAATYPLDRAAEAYERFQAGAKFGKIIIQMDG